MPQGVVVGKADVADLAGLHELLQHPQRLGYRGKFILVPGLESQLAEEIRVSLRPVQLIQVDAIDLQAPQAAIQRRLQVIPVETCPALADVVDPAHPGTCYLAGKHHPFAVAGPFQPLADEHLGLPIGVRPGRYRVQLRGIKEIHAQCKRVVHLLECLGPGVLLPPGHGA